MALAVNTTKRVLRWKEGEEEVTGKTLLEVADALLYVESALSGLDRLDLSNLDLVDASDDTKYQLMARSQLQEAELLVIKEAQAGITLAKRAITSFMDSNWDGMHLTNVPVTLRSVWGGLIFLQLPRAAEVVRVCEQFIEQKLIRDRADKPSNSTMETLADAITSIDYFLEGMEDNKPIGDGVLDVAEDSMRELGFPVQAA